MLLLLGDHLILSLYSEEHVTFEEDDVYDQYDAEGFIKLNALRLKLLKKD
jgi:argininosuccinate synthase